MWRRFILKSSFRSRRESLRGAVRIDVAMSDSVEMQKTAAPSFQRHVIIIGGGPVGMMLAMQLDRFGVQSVIVNTLPRPQWHPKGGTHNARTMEHYRRLGLAADIRKLGLPPDHPTDVVYVTRLNGWELQRITMPSEREKMRSVAEAELTDQVPEPLLRCNQMHVEAYLFDRICTLENVVNRFGWRCVGLNDHGSGVTAEIEDADTGERETLSGAYVVGCDGGQSLVRRALSIRYDGEQPEPQAYLGGRMVSTYIRSSALRERIIRKIAWQYWTVNRDIRSNTLSIDGKSEFLFNTRLRDDQDKPDDDSISRAFIASVGQNIRFEVVQHSTWIAGQALVAEQFGSGRVVMAGDAVHLFTPTGGFGMNTGVDDAVNLGWKLAALVQGWGGVDLLKSYELERRPIALRNTAAAKLLARNVGAVPVAPEIEDHTDAGAFARLKASEFLSTFGGEFGSLGIQLGARYDSSPIIVSDGATPPGDDPLIYTVSSVPGGRAPHVWLEKGLSLFDCLGWGFTLLAFREDSAAVKVERTALSLGIPFKILKLFSGPARDLYQRDFALIRPDQHVAWRGNHLPEDCWSLLRRVTGCGLEKSS
jgi:2-polyprenyl-6-methoxyphenol hydroxylase-like FAD-dependent oxidoreductase